MKTVLGERVLIEPVTPFTDMDRVEKEGLLIIHQKAREDNAPPPTSGIVLQLGVELIEKWHHFVDKGEWPLQEGDMVVFSKFAGMQLQLEGRTLLILNYQEVVAVLEATNPGAVEVVGD